MRFIGGRSWPPRIVVKFRDMADVGTESIFSWKFGLYFLAFVATVGGILLLERYGFLSFTGFWIGLSIMVGLMTLIDGRSDRTKIKFFRGRPVLWAAFSTLTMLAIYPVVWTLSKFVFPHLQF
jgi:hypothetical protein